MLRGYFQGSRIMGSAISVAGGRVAPWRWVVGQGSTRSLAAALVASNLAPVVLVVCSVLTVLNVLTVLTVLTVLGRPPAFEDQSFADHGSMTSLASLFDRALRALWVVEHQGSTSPSSAWAEGATTPARAAAIATRWRNARFTPGMLPPRLTTNHLAPLSSSRVPGVSRGPIALCGRWAGVLSAHGPDVEEGRMASSAGAGSGCGGRGAFFRLQRLVPT